MERSRHSLKKFRGPGIAAVGYLAVALSSALIVIALKVGQFTELPRWIYFLPMLLGIVGAVAGFVIGAGGVVITWASFGDNEVNLDWLTTRAARLQWRRPTDLFRWSAICVTVAIVLGAIVYFGFDSGLPLSGIFFLAAAAFVYLGIIAKLWQFLTSELLRLPI
jgi:hypothetical protein